MDIENRLRSLAATLEEQLEDLRRLHDHYDSLVGARQGEDVDAMPKWRALRDRISSHEAQLAAVRHLLGDEATPAHADWIQRELAGEVMVMDKATRKPVPLTDTQRGEG